MFRTIRPCGPQPAGTDCLIPEFGSLAGPGETAMLDAPLPERMKRVAADLVKDFRSDERITLPHEPFIETIGISPESVAMTSLHPDDYGGNMDLPDVAPGAIICLPVKASGALLYPGDCQAAQGNGERFGLAIGHPAVTIEDAARIACRELVHLMASDYGFTELHAYMLLTHAGGVRLGNMVDL